MIPRSTSTDKILAPIPCGYIRCIAKQRRGCEPAVIVRRGGRA